MPSSFHIQKSSKNKHKADGCHTSLRKREISYSAASVWLCWHQNIHSPAWEGGKKVVQRTRRLHPLRIEPALSRSTKLAQAATVCVPFSTCPGRLFSSTEFQQHLSFAFINVILSCLCECSESSITRWFHSRVPQIYMKYTTADNQNLILTVCKFLRKCVLQYEIRRLTPLWLTLREKKTKEVERAQWSSQESNRRRI